MDGMLILRRGRIDFLPEELPDGTLSHLEKCGTAFVQLETHHKKSVDILTKGADVLVKNMPILVKSAGVLVKSTGIRTTNMGILVKSVGALAIHTGIPAKSTGVFIESTAILVKSEGTPTLSHNFVNSVNFVQTLSAYLVIY